MNDFDPDSSDVTPRGRRAREGARDRQQTEHAPNRQDSETHTDHKAKALAFLSSKAVRFTGLWALVTVLLVQIIKLFSRNFTFSENYSGVLAVTLIIAAGLRFLATRKLNIAGAVAVGVVLDRLSRPIRGLFGAAWTLLVLGFFLVFVTQCSQNPNVPVENIFFKSLDSYFSWLGDLWRQLLWRFGWN